MECELFPDIKGHRLLLRSVSIRETLIESILDQATEIFSFNTAGPQKYLQIYKHYEDFLSGKADEDVAVFLSESHSLEAFQEVGFYSSRKFFTNFIAFFVF